MLKTLEDLGLPRLDAQVYIFLGKRGPQKAKDVTKALKIRKQQLYTILKNLQSKGLASATLEHPAKFSALPFEKVLDLFVSVKIGEAKRIETDRDNLICDWRSVAAPDVADQSPKFTVIEGNNYIYPRLRQMIGETKNKLFVVSDVAELVETKFSLLDSIIRHSEKTKAKVRLLTEISPENLQTIKQLLKKSPKSKMSLEARTPELGLKLTSRMVIKDENEAVFFVNQDSDKGTRNSEEVALWTNSKGMVESFIAVFEDYWRSSVDIDKKIVEIESGKPITKTYVITDPATAKIKYNELLDGANRQIVIITSAAGLGEVLKRLSALERGVKEGLSIKVMSPITHENLETAIKLSNCCEVRHVRTGYLGTIIVDGTYLFQFKNPPPNKERQDELLNFQDVFFTSDQDYIRETQNILDEIWKTASSPSSITVEEIPKARTLAVAPIPDEEYSLSGGDSIRKKCTVTLEEEVGVITEEYVLNKIINAKRILPQNKSKDVLHIYGSTATAVIHPPSTFNLPDTLLVFYHNNKQSSFGAEDWFVVCLWLETSRGYEFVPVSIAGDNRRGIEHRRLNYVGTPASQNAHLLKKNQLKIQVHGNTLFAGWTVPIPLFPSSYTLPPGGLLVEGYGKLKPVVTTYSMPSGVRSISEGNYFDAFVTFFHPTSKYAGAGTDGILGRENIIMVYPKPIFEPNNKESDRKRSTPTNPKKL